jgi:hypothetical protein
MVLVMGHVRNFRICNHIANQTCEPDLWSWKVPVLEYYRSWVAPTGFRAGFAATLWTGFVNRICGPGGFPYWSNTKAGQHPPDLRTGFAATLRTGFVNWICGNDVVRNFRLIDGHNLNYGHARWTMSVMFRLIESRNLSDGFMRWTMSTPFV